MRNLSLEQKHAAVKMVVSDKIKVKDVAKHFDCGKTQIYQALKNRYAIEENIHHNKNAGKKKKIRIQRTVELNEAVFEWYRTAKARNLPVNGPMLQQKAIEIAHYLNVENFRASNGWLDSFRKNRQISFKTECEESNESDTNVTITIKSELDNITSGYEPKDIANVDEMAIFFRALPKSITTLKGETCQTGNMANERITVLLTVFGDGKIWKPWVIGKSCKPLSFKNIEKNQLPVIYRQNSKAFLTTAIFKEYLQTLNRQMMLEQRKILLLLDDASCHANIKLSNINLVFLPADCVSVSLPLNSGISQWVKVHYRKIMLQKLISLSNAYATKLINHKINVLDAIMMLLQALKKVTPTYIEKTFKSCGFLVEATEIQPLNLDMLELENLVQDSHFADADSLSFAAPDYLAIDENLCTEIDCSDIQMHFLPSDDEFDSDSSDIAEKVTPLASSKELFCSLSTLKNYAMLKNKFSIYEKLEDIQFDIEKEFVKPKNTKKSTLVEDPLKDPLS